MTDDTRHMALPAERYRVRLLTAAIGNAGISNPSETSVSVPVIPSSKNPNGHISLPSPSLLVVVFFLRSSSVPARGMREKIIRDNTRYNMGIKLKVHRLDYLAEWNRRVYHYSQLQSPE